jgi:hypothetical protein
MRTPRAFLTSAAFFVSVACVFAPSLGCGANQSQGPNYSRVPCADNCGSDPQCQASCTEIGPAHSPQPYMNK